MLSAIECGTLVLIPVSSDRGVVGQVIAPQRGISVALALHHGLIEFGSDWDSRAARQVQEPIDAIVVAFVDRLQSGEWPHAGALPVVGAELLPAYKLAVGTPDNIQVEDFAGTQRRPATAEEADALPHRSESSPTAVERLAQALNGLAPWIARFDRLRPNPSLTSAALFGHTPG